LGDNVILINQATMAGHVEIGDHTIVGHSTPIVQFCRVGRHAFVVTPSVIVNDVIPFGVVKGMRQDCALQGLNLIGLKNRGFSRETIRCLREAYKIIFDGSPIDIVERARHAGQKFADCGPVMELVGFITEYPERKLVFPAKRGTVPLEVAE
ncbi:MAG: acyl-[acyl-carrier-protein]--UDP-N-acetylglucosamine O-acyltransferase, partial [Rhizobiales bacterium]|nr:acyl-[acyl-carrier-protein]--UDP-N-acetylglucosamine O-acyltransferase [Hyphomicrobiales bacterium]